MCSHWTPFQDSILNHQSGFTVDLENSEWNYVKDYVINGTGILSGSTFLSIINKLHPKKSIHEVDFLTPVLPSSPTIQFVVRDSNGPKTLCVDGMDAVSFFLHEDKSNKPTVARNDVQGKKILKFSEIYERFSSSMLDYPKKFQVVSMVGVLSGSGMSELNNFGSADTLLNGALQSVVIGYLIENPNDHHLWLPFSIETVRIFNSNPDGKTIAYFTYSSSGFTITGDVSVFDRDGNLLLDIKKIVFYRKETEERATAPILTERKLSPIVKPSDNLRCKAKSYIRNWFKKSFGWNDLDENVVILNLGLSSLQTVRLRNYLREEYPSAITTLVFDHPTILDLSTYLASLEMGLIGKEAEVKEENVTVKTLTTLSPSRLSQYPIGIRSAACRLPGGIEDPADFWQLLLTGLNPSSRTPANRIPSRNILIRGQKYGSSVEGGNFLHHDVAAFDSSFFKISKSEAEVMDPQQRLLLECVEECIENSGDMEMTEVGVFVGLMEKEYPDLMEQQQMTILSMLGSMVSVVAGRVNYVFGSYGPSVTIDTACSSSLVAIELAVNALLDGRCKRAIVAGVNLILSEQGQGYRSNGKMLSSHGMSLSFDARASGYGRSDGCVVLMLEKMKPTVNYLSVLKGVNVNHGGRSVSLTAPNGMAHNSLLTNLFQATPGVKANVWEAHGTGTSVGDPIEVNTLSSLLQDAVVSSTKASLGHGEASAGTCGLLKLSLTLTNDYIPALIHFHVLNKEIQLGSLRLPVVGEESNFEAGGISSFGVSGTNAAILAEKTSQIVTKPSELHSVYLLPISAKNNNSLTTFQKAITEFVIYSRELMPDICGALANRHQHSKRAVILVSRERAITTIEKQEILPKFCLLEKNLHFDILAIEEVREYFKCLARFNISNTDKLLLATVKFLMKIIEGFVWVPTSLKSNALYLLASDSLDINEETIRLLEEKDIPTTYRDRMKFIPKEPTAGTISLGGKITNLQSLLTVLGELFVGGIDLDWKGIYTSPSRFIQLPTYPFNRQIIWFTEKKPVYEHNLLGTEVERTESRITFENQLSPIRHSAIFKYEFGLGEAIQSIVEAGRQILSSTFKIVNMTLTKMKVAQSNWLTVSLHKNSENCSVVGKLGMIEIFSCTLEKTSSSVDWNISQSFEGGRHQFFESIPSTIVTEYSKLTVIEAIYDCPYRALFHILERKNLSLKSDIHVLLPLEKNMYLIEEDEVIRIGTENRICFEIQPREGMRPMAVLKPLVVPSITETKNIESSTIINCVSNSLENIKENLLRALNDVLPEEVTSGDERGFIEMGMDSLTLVDFVNRLNERYFKNLEINTTDVFDHPSVAEMTDHIQKLLKVEKPKSDNAIQEMKVSTSKEINYNVQANIKQALIDVLPEEPSDDFQGFMEMGMDSLTLVDFVNRLNEKYFPNAEISTTDVFDHPSLTELTAHIASLGYGQKSLKPVDNVKPVVELLLEKGKLEEVRTKICKALLDVLPEEIEDFSVGFMEMGMDSLTLLDFVNRLNEKYFTHFEISAIEVFDHPTVQELTQNIMERIERDKEEIKVDLDSGVDCSGEMSPIDDKEILLDAFLVTKEKKSILPDYKLVNKLGTLLIVIKEQELELDEKTVRTLQPGKTLSVDLDEEKLSPEELFIGLLNFCKLLEKLRIPLNIYVPDKLSSSQFMAKAFMKTAAAEKPNIIRYVWTEQLQRKPICEFDLQGNLEGFWLITGGLSGIGLSTARWLVEQGVDGVALISRRTPDEQLKNELEAMRKKAKMVVISADITDSVKIREKIGKLERIDGVIHCAGVLQDGKMERQNSASFKKVFGPKGDGYDVLDKILLEFNHKPSTFIVMSSFTFVCGNVGQLNYGVANAYLDYKMAERRKRGETGTSIHWGNWLETGMAANSNIHKILSGYGLAGLSTEEGLKYLKYAILKKPEHFLTAKVNWKIFLERRKDIRQDLIKKGFYEESTEEQEFRKLNVVDDVNMREGSGGEEESVKIIRSKLTQIAQGLMKNKVMTNKSFLEMGFTFHALATLLEIINEELSVNLTVAVFDKNSTIDTLAEYLSNLKNLKAAGNSPTTSSYCDVLAYNIYYDSPDEFKAKCQLTAQGQMRGKYLQQVQGNSLQEIKEKLAVLEYQEMKPETKRKLVMMFSGQGTQYPLMGAQLAESIPEFKRIFHYCLRRCNELLQTRVSILEVINNPNNYQELLLTSYMQPVMFSFCYALGHFWQTIGIKPDVYLGHSVGELVAGVFGGIMSLDEGIQLIVARAKTMERTNGRGAMLAIDSKVIDEVLENFEVSIAAINSPKQLVIAGKREVLDSVLQFVKGCQLQATYLNTMYPFHSKLIIEEDLVELRQTIKEIKFKRSNAPIVSNVTGSIIWEFNEEYLIKHTMSPVKFVNCAETLMKEGVKIWLEVGPSATLSQFLRNIVEPKGHLILQSIQDHGNELAKLIETALKLEKNGICLNWEKVYCEEKESDQVRLIEFPRRTTLEISQKEATIAADHVMKDEIVIAGMYQMYKILNEINQESTTDFFTLRDVRIPHPWKLNHGHRAEIIRSFDNRVSIEVGGKITCLASLKQWKSTWKQILSESSFGGCTTSIDVKGWYIVNGKNGLFYGPHFRVLKEARISDKRAVATGVVQENSVLWTLMDGALHLTWLVVSHRRRREYYLPVSLNEVFLDHKFTLQKGQKIRFLAEIVAENEKFLQFNSVLVIDGATIFEARNVTCVIFQAEDEEISDQKNDRDNGEMPISGANQVQKYYKYFNGIQSKSGTVSTGFMSNGLEKSNNRPNTSQINGSCINQSESSNTVEAPAQQFCNIQKSTREVIMVGSAGSFCFDSIDLPSLWQQLQLGISSHKYRDRNPVVNTNVSFIDQDITQWDPEFFAISPKEAPFVDPMQRMLLVMVHRALENSGFPSLPPSTGVFVAQSGMEFIQMVYQERHKELPGSLTTGTHGSCLSGRISHWLKLEGPSVVIDTACSSSFTALILAAEAISSGRIDMAIVAGVHIILHDSTTQVLSKGSMLSDRCKVFDASADGYRRSEGIGVVLLASEDYCSKNDLFRIARLANWHLGHNGKSAAMQVPNGASQEMSMRLSGGHEREVEMHATGTKLGDPIEASSVNRLGSSTVSSIKSHLGHAEGASGMASLLAVLLQMKHKYRIPQLHFACPNPKILDLPFRIIGEEVDFGRIRINNFGFSGSNASISLERIEPVPEIVQIRRFYLIPFSAKTKEEVNIMRNDLMELLKYSDVPLSVLAANYQKRPNYRRRDILLVDFKRKITTTLDEESFSHLDDSELEFFYGHGVASAEGDLLHRIRSVLHDAGTLHLPEDILSPIDFYGTITKEFLLGVSINWTAIDNQIQSQPTTLPGYRFNNRHFWCFSESPVDSRSNIYFVKVLSEKPRKGTKNTRNIFSATINSSSFQTLDINQLETLQDAVLLFESVDNSYEEAVSLCKLWERLDECHQVMIVVACKDNGSMFTEWTALLRSLAAEKQLKYAFVAYQKDEELSKELGELEEFEAVHYRGGRRYVERLEKVDPTQTIREVNHLLISGGDGGIGQAIVNHLQPKKTTILSRSLGIDMSNPMIKLEIDEDVDLIVHAAGVVDNALLKGQTVQKFKNVGDVKINGLKALSAGSGNRKMILISSAAAIFGSLGQANYAFCNGRMTSLAEISGKFVQVIYFGPWSGVGVLSGKSLQSIREQIQQGGWNFIEPAVALQAMNITNSVIVFDGNFNLILEKNPHLYKFLENMVPKPPEENAREKKFTSVSELIKHISGLNNLDEEKDTPLMQLGLDSLMMEELRTTIRQHFHVKISSAELYDNCTTALLQNFLAQRVESRHEQVQKSNKTEVDDHRVAIIGMSGSFSGSKNIHEFWESLVKGKESIIRGETDNGFVSAAGVVPDVDKFDYKFFKVTKEDADDLDPQVRIFLQHAYNALESSGYVKKRSHLRIGVFAGAEPSEYSNGEEEPIGSLQRMFLKNMKDFVTTMTAHKLDLNGPGINVYSACSTSIVALQQGVSALQLGQIDLALIGAVSLILPDQISYEFQEGMVLSKTGICRPFDISADGTVRGSACGCFVLKPFKKAKEDNDPILSVIHGVGTCNDGALKASFMAPNTRGQIDCMRQAISQLEEDEKKKIVYVECHGTGTLVGDEIELNALRNVYGNGIKLGSVKANIGHGFAGAGIASLVKTVMILETGLIPPQINFKKPIEAGKEFVFNSTLEVFPKDSFLAVSSFGIGGTNGHVILGPHNNAKSKEGAYQLPLVLPISAKSLVSLQLNKSNIHQYVSTNPNRVKSVRSTLCNNREEFQYRSALLVQSESIYEIPNFQSVNNLSPKNVAFFFSPQGVQYENMEKMLLNTKSAFSQKIRELCTLATKITGVDYFHVMYPSSEDENLILRPDLAQVAVFIINMATIAQLTEWGIQSSSVLGHSVGEYAALTYCGVISEEESIKLLFDRGKLCNSTPGAMMIAIKGEILDLPAEVEISAILSENLYCVVGPKEQMKKLMILLEQECREYRELKTERGFHSHMMDSVLNQFEKEVSIYRYKKPTKTIISGMSGEVLNQITPNYLREHMRQPVNLKTSLKKLFSNKEIKVIVEIGPSGVLQSLLKEEYPNIVYVSTIPHKKRAHNTTLWNSLAEMWCHSYPIEWNRIYGESQRDPYCPGYDFERTVCWKEKISSAGHKFYSISWIPFQNGIQVDQLRTLLVTSSPEKAVCEIHCIHPDRLAEWKLPTDILIFKPHEKRIFFEILDILKHVHRLNVQRLLVVSQGNSMDWLALGPLREFQLLNKQPICQFIENPEGLSLTEVMNRAGGTLDDCLLITQSFSFRLGYSEVHCDENVYEISGIVVIFGGTGYLGSAYVTVLLENPAVKQIVVVGRRKEHTHRGIHYEQADITVPEDVENILTKVIQLFGGFDVVVNLAGITTKNSLEKSLQEMENVLAPKVKGTQNIICFLEKVNHHLPLLILSSSLSSYLPIQGNNDYAAANCFLDALAIKGHPMIKKIQTIQWPLWNGDGMAISPSVHVEHFLKRGSLSTPQGLRAIRKSLSHSGCLAYSFLHPTQLRQHTTKAQLGTVLLEDSTQKDQSDNIVTAWKDILSCSIDEQSNFFDLGGNSLNALRLIWQLNNSLGIKLTVDYVFTHPIFGDFCQNLPKSRTKEKQTEIDVLNRIPVSYAQENMLLLRMIDPGPQYNIVFLIEFGKVDLERMNVAIRGLIARQLGLRTAFKKEDNEFDQEVLSLTECYHCLESQDFISNEQIQPILEFEKLFDFDFSVPPLRIKWIKTEVSQMLLFNQHHILTDGWSMTVLANELSQGYKEAGKMDISRMERNVPVFAINNRKILFDDDLAYLKTKLSDLRTTRLVRDVNQNKGFGRTVKYIPNNIVTGIKGLAKRHKTTEFVVCLSAFLLTLKRWKEEADENELVVGIPVSGRDEQSQDLIGYFLNNIVLRVKIKDELTLDEVIPLVDKGFTEARKMEHVPFHRLVAALEQERQKGQHPVFQIYFNYRHTLDYPRVHVEGRECKVKQVSMNTLFDLSTTIDETPEGLQVMLEYNKSFYLEETVDQFTKELFRSLIRKKKEYFLKGKKLDTPRFLRLQDKMNYWPNEEVETQSMHYLLEQEFTRFFGIQPRPDSIVVLVMSPNNTAKAIPAVIKAGMAYAPLDPSWPETKKEDIKNGLPNSFCIDDNFFRQEHRRNRTLPFIRNQCIDLVYVIHTSGSTGKPKGVVVSYKNLTTFLTMATRQMMLNQKSRVYNSVNTVFDVSVSNILGAAVNNSYLIMQKDLRDQINEAKECSYVFLTSAVFNSLSVNQLDKLQSVEKLFIGGESIQEKNLQIILSKGIDVTQIYGPTEGTIWSTTKRCKMEINEGRNIGQPMGMETTKVRGGPIGELVLEGDKVARGYLHEDGFRGVFPTKDLVRIIGNQLVYLGRLDGQVKIRGNRVEVQEIETQIIKLTEARNVVVLKSEENLVAFIVGFVPSKLRESLQQYLPSYSIPSTFISVHEIPRNSSGKVDKKRLLQDFYYELRKSENSKSEENRDIINSIEEKMLKVFSETLNKEVNQIEDNFFNMGGHSLLLLTLQQNIKEQFEVEPSVFDLFAHPTPEGAAKLVVDLLKLSLNRTDISIINKLREVPNSKFNVYLIHAVGGAIFPYYAFLQIFPRNISVYAIEYQLEYKAETLKELAALYAKAITVHTKDTRPFVLGHSMGGTISREMIPDLKMWGWEIPFVIMYDTWVVRPEQIRVEKIKEFMETIFASLPNAAARVEGAMKLSIMLKNHRMTKSWTKIYLFKSKELGVVVFRKAVRPDLNEDLSRSLVANGFERVSYQPVTTWMINGDHESCLKVENLKTRQKELLSIFKAYL